MLQMEGNEFPPSRILRKELVTDRLVPCCKPVHGHVYDGQGFDTQHGKVFVKYSGSDFVSIGIS